MRKSPRVALPKGTPEVFASAIDGYAEALFGELGTLLTGILVAGSVAHGTADASSDVDLYVIIDAAWYQRRRPVVDGVTFDAFLGCQAMFIDAILHKRKDACVESFAHGWNIFDALGEVAELQRLAAKVLEISVSETRGESFRAAQRFNDSFRKFMRIADKDGVEATLELHFLVRTAIDAYYTFTGRWRPRRSLILGDLRLHAIEIYGPIASLLQKNDGFERESAAELLREGVLALRPGAFERRETRRRYFRISPRRLHLNAEAVQDLLGESSH
jgi:hypothetical protein